MTRRPRWIWMGHALTALWIGAVIILTGGDPAHALFDFIFTVPLAGWVLALIVRRLVAGRSNGDRP